MRGARYWALKSRAAGLAVGPLAGEFCCGLWKELRREARCWLASMNGYMAEGLKPAAAAAAAKAELCWFMASGWSVCGGACGGVGDSVGVTVALSVLGCRSGKSTSMCWAIDLVSVNLRVCSMSRNSSCLDSVGHFVRLRSFLS